MKVLVVDDELITREWLVLIISSMGEGFAVCGQAKNGREALEIAEREKPELIITDIRMPVMDGIEMVKALRGAGDPVAVVIMSAYSEFEYVRAALRQDVFEYVLKPEITAEILADILCRLRDRLRERGAADRREQPEQDDPAARLRRFFETEPMDDYASPIRSACAYLHGHYTEDIKLQSLSERVYLNMNYFSELFRRNTGITFSKYLNSLRVYHAAEVLEKTNHSVTQVALYTGFSNVSYFIRVFKALMGKSPAVYQREKKMKLSEKSDIRNTNT